MHWAPVMADDKFTEKEAQRRFEATLRGALKTPPQLRGKEPLNKRGVSKDGGGKASPDRRRTKSSKED